MGSASLTSKAMTLAVGTTSYSNCSRFGVISMFKLATPVMFPPGRSRAAMSPRLTGSPAISKTIGMVVVAAFAASAAGVLAVAITDTWLRTNSAAIVDS